MSHTVMVILCIAKSLLQLLESLFFIFFFIYFHFVVFLCFLSFLDFSWPDEKDAWPQDEWETDSNLCFTEIRK